MKDIPETSTKILSRLGFSCTEPIIKKEFVVIIILYGKNMTTKYYEISYFGYNFHRKSTYYLGNSNLPGSGSASPRFL